MIFSRFNKAGPCPKPRKEPPPPSKRRKKSPKSKATALEREYMGYVATLGCVCCKRIPVEVHHPIVGRFSQKRAPHFHTIPLCDTHHQGKWDPSGPAIHKDRAEWVELYGADYDYIAETQSEIERAYGFRVPDEYRIITDLEGEL